jgi:hypothetical protein
MIAVLHAFMAQHPEVSALPIWWQVDARRGISAGITQRPGAGGIVGRLADLLGVDVTTLDSVGEDGSRRRLTTATATLGGLPFFAFGTTVEPTQSPANAGLQVQQMHPVQPCRES